MKVRVLLIILLVSFKAFAQNAVSGLVSGRISEKDNGKMLPLAVISLVDQDNQKTIKRIRSGNNGEFKLVNIPFGNFSLIITHIGFEKEIIEDIELTADEPVFNTGNIKLKKQDNALNEVVITEKKRTVTYDADQITYNVAESLEAEGSTATDILRNVPMVMLDADGTPTIAGKRNTRILIDGEPSDYMTANIADLLNVLPSEAIEKIEVLLNPPVRYSADGDAVINIILKKDFKLGLNGTASLGAGTLGTYNANSYASYKHKKLSFTGSYSFADNPASSVNTTTQHFFSDTNFYRNQNVSSTAHNYGHNISESAGWDIDSSKTLRLSLNFNFNRAILQSTGDFHSLNNNQVQTGASTSVGSNHSNSANYVFNLKYSWRFKKGGGRLDAVVTFNGNTVPTNRLSLRYYQNAKGVPINRPPFEQTYAIGTAYDGVQTKIDYDKPWAKNKNSISFGLSSDVRTNNNNQDVENMNPTTLAQTQVNALSNTFKQHQAIYAGYGSTTIRSGNGWQYRVGARAEIAFADYVLQQVGQPAAKSQYIDPTVRVFPNASISKRIQNKFTLGLSYSQRIARPNNTALNPLVASPDSNNVSYRNLNITPAYTQQVDLSLGVFTEKWSFYPRLTYSYTNNTIERYITVDRLGRAQYAYDNLGPSTYNTINLYGDYRPTHSLIINGGTTIGQVSYKKSAYLPDDHSAYSFYSKVGMSLVLPRNAAIEGNFGYFTSPFAQVNQTAPVTTSFAVRKSFYHNKLRLRLLANTPFGQSNYKTISQGSNFYWQSNNLVTTRNYTATLSYNFTTIKTSAKAR